MSDDQSLTNIYSKMVSNDEIQRNMILMGCKSLDESDRSKIIFRN